MDIKSIELNCRLGEIIHEKMNVIMHTPLMYHIDDKYAEVPTLYFRFKDNTCDDDYRKIQELLQSFAGSGSWCIFKYPISRINYAISVVQYKEYSDYLYRQVSDNADHMSPQEYFGYDKYISICDNIFADLESLCKWVNERL